MNKNIINNVYIYIFLIYDFQIIMGNQSFHKQQQNQQLRRFLIRFGQLKTHPTKTLYKINQISDGKSFLLKQIATNDEIQKESILKLIEKKRKSKCSYVVSLEDHFLHMQANYCSNQFKVFLIFQIIPKSLKDQIINRRISKKYFTEEQVLIIIESVFYGLIQLYNVNHAHESICSSKILIDEKGYIRISDPWLNEQDITFKSSHYIYMSPEKLDLINNKRIQKIDWLLSDLFSLGMIALEILNLEFMDDIYYNNNKSINFIQLNQKISSIRYQQVKRYVQMLLGNLHSRSTLLNQFICKFPSTPIHLNIPKPMSNYKKPLEIDLPSSQISYLPSYNNSITPVSSKSMANLTMNLGETTQKISSIPFISNSHEKEQSKIPHTKISFTNKKIYNIPMNMNSMCTRNITTPIKQINSTLHKNNSHEFKSNANSFVKIRVVNNFQNGSNLNMSHQQKILKSSYCKKSSFQKFVPQFNKDNINKNVYTNPGMGQIYIPILKFKQNSIPQNGKSSHQTLRSCSTNYLDNVQKIQKTQKTQQVKEKLNQNINQIQYKNQQQLQMFTDQKKILGQEKSAIILPQNQQVKINIQNLTSIQKSNDKQQKISQFVQQQIKIQYNNTDPYQQSQLYLLSYDQNNKMNNQQYEIKIHPSSAEHTPQRKSTIHPNKYNSTILQVSQTDQSPVQTIDEQTQFVIQQYGQGSKYEGQKKKKMKNGHGIFYYKDGGYYQGEWKDDRMHGMGKLYYNNHKLAYQGNWFMDEFHGFGKVYNDIPQQLNSAFDYANFDNIQQFWEYYEGNLISDVKEGFGKLKLSNGQIFQGEFKKDKIDGTGRFFTKKGDIINGIWKNSKLIKVL